MKSLRFLRAPYEGEFVTGPTDFCLTRPGEYLVFGTVCGKGHRGDTECGCERSFIGSETRKGTTVGIVEETETGNAELWARALARVSLKNFNGGKEPKPEEDKRETKRVQLLLESIAYIRPGSCVSVKWIDGLYIVKERPTA